MAPSHTFDLQTLTALNRLGFRSVTDGFGIFPYREIGLTFVPQLFSSGINFGIGVYTIALHLNYLTSRNIIRIEKFISLNRKNFTTFDKALKFEKNDYLNFICRMVCKHTINNFRRIKNVASC